MAVKLFAHNDASAPVLNNAPGSLIALLDACLINGYGAKAAVGGWEKRFTATNKAVYRSTHVDATGMHLRIDDSGSLVATVRGYVDMSDVDTGTEPFPTVAQRALATYCTHRTSADVTTARAWWLVADERMFYLTIISHTSYPSTAAGLIFGDYNSYLAGDAYNCVIKANIDTTATSPGTFGIGHFGNSNAAFYSARSRTQLANTALAQLVACSSLTDYSANAGGGVTTGYHFFAPLGVVDGTVIGSDPIRGELPGLTQILDTVTYTTLPLGTQLVMGADSRNGVLPQNLVILPAGTNATVGSLVAVSLDGWR